MIFPSPLDGLNEREAFSEKEGCRKPLEGNRRLDEESPNLLDELN